MKKLFLVLVGLLMALALTACGSQAANNGGSQNGAATAAPAKTTLVVYYSDTGRTQQVAEAIAKAADADIVRLEADPAYTAADLDYRDENSRVSREHNDPALREQVKLKQTEIPNWAGYKTVYIGFPIWWGLEAWPVDPFVKANDFSGKKVIPFATAYSSPLGTSGEELKKLAGNKGDWQEGTCFTGEIDTKAVTDWVNSLK